jgi:hypothetical protein
MSLVLLVENGWLLKKGRLAPPPVIYCEVGYFKNGVRTAYALPLT